LVYRKEPDHNCRSPYGKKKETGRGSVAKRLDQSIRPDKLVAQSDQVGKKKKREKTVNSRESHAVGGIPRRKKKVAIPPGGGLGLGPEDKLGGQGAGGGKLGGGNEVLGGGSLIQRLKIFGGVRFQVTNVVTRSRGGKGAAGQGGGGDL